MYPEAKVIADSESEKGIRLVTMEVRMHRFVLAEFNTHRQFSRNSASSRAIPVNRMMDKYITEPAYPLQWVTEQAGMSGGSELDLMEQVAAQNLFEDIRNYTVNHIRDYLGFCEAHNLRKLHKSLLNRLMEPMQWHTVIVSSTHWTNFWGQRVSPLAQPEMRAVAEKMKEAFDTSVSKAGMKTGEWHLPYVTQEDYNAHPKWNVLSWKDVSAARCARVSYLTHDGQRDATEDLKLASKLLLADPPHWSPFEHVATPSDHTNPARSNFKGWHQYRRQLEMVSLDV